VNAVSGSPGSTVNVCPGTYAEQVVVNQAITVKGIVNGTSGAVIITVPAGGLVANVTTPTYGNESAQLLVQNFTGAQAKIMNLAIDGTGASVTCPPAPAKAPHTVGIKVYNVGDPTYPSAGALLQNVIVRHEINGCQTGDGIDSENSFSTITGAIIHDVDGNGIVQTGGSAVVNSNTLSNVHGWGIWLSGAPQSTVTSNILSTQTGILIDAGSNGTSVTSNVVIAGYGIELNQVSSNDVKNNRIVASFAGLFVNQSSNNSLTGNTVRFQYYGIIDEASTGGNTIINNTVNEGLVCMYLAATSTDTVSPNTLQNCSVTTQIVP
jgi:parallel beta-helix repeat protein